MRQHLRPRSRSTCRRRLLFFPQVASLGTAGLLFTNTAAAAPAADTIDFATTIRPLLVAKCGDCHGPDTQESGLRLDVRHRAFKGGDFGPVILAGKAAESELVKRITHADSEMAMPPDEPLSVGQIAVLSQWIDAGADWPETEADRVAWETDRDPRLDYGAWQPIVKPTVPATVAKFTARPGVQPERNAIDFFIRQKLAEKGLAPSPVAVRATLIRWLAFDGRLHDDGTTTLLEGDLFGPLRDTRVPASVEKLLTPLEPRDILCVGLNYRQHAAESGAEPPAHPVLFLKNSGAVQNPGGPIVLPRRLRSDEVD